jgi:2,3-bisphosphoglycerate-independent phosphoglycerate mutase
MKYVVLIIDGAAGHPIPQKGNKTSLELAKTPYLDALTRKGKLGLTCNVPTGMEPSSAIACMSIMGYDPRTYYGGRSAIEAVSMGIEIGKGEAVFRCNLVAVKDGKMWDYSAGHITTAEARELILTIDQKLGNADTKFYPGVSYRHALKLKGNLEPLQAVCTPPHDIPGKAIAPYLPKGKGSQVLLDLMQRSEAVLKDHPVNRARISRGEIPATTIWLFWPSGQVPGLPPFQKNYGLKAGMISGVDLLRGLAQMAEMEIIKVPGVTDGLDNDYVAQAEGTMKALEKQDLVIVHVEAPDEAGHSGSMEHKIEAIEKTDLEIVRRLSEYKGQLRLLILPDHPTPLDIQTHTPDQVPFLLVGEGIAANGAKRLTEVEARATNFSIQNGYDIMKTLLATRA